MARGGKRLDLGLYAGEWGFSVKEMNRDGEGGGTIHGPLSGLGPLISCSLEILG